MDTMTQLGGNWTNVGFGYFNADLGKYIDYEGNILNPAQVLEKRSYLDGGGGNIAGGGSSPTFQFPKGQEAYYQKNYPAFYDFVKNVLPNITKDANFLNAFMEITGMSEEEVKKAFTCGQGATLHDWDVEFSQGQYDYAWTHYEGDLNNISIAIPYLNWFEKANKDTSTLEGVSNLFYMSVLIGHEGGHWGFQVKGPNDSMKNFISKFNNEHGDAFTYKLFINDFPQTPAHPGYLGFGDILKGGTPYNFKEYVKRNFNNLSKIFKP